MLLALLCVALAGCGSGGHHRTRIGSTTTTTTSTATTRSSPPPALAAPSGVAYGLNVNRLFNDRRYTSAQIGAQLSAVAATGVTLARSDSLWELSEPRPPVNGVHSYDWQFDDTIAGDLAAHGLTWLPIVDYSALWSESVKGADHSPPASDADYAAYAAGLARRYGPGGAFWAAHPALTARPVSTIEIWNEPDNREFWAPSPDPAAYASLYLDARDAIAAAVPTTRVIIGGLTDPIQTLPAMLKAEPALAGQTDGVAVHPYGVPLAMVGKIRDDRRTLTALGMGSVPLYVTEFGWVTRPAGALSYVPPERRPAYIRTALAALGHLNCGLAAVVYYTWITPEHDPANREDWFGIEPPDGRPGPDTHAFVDGLRAAEAAAPTIPACSG